LRETLFRDVRGLPAALLAARRALEAERAASVKVEEAAAPVPDAEGAADAAEQMTLF
jgi:hypothetical protein